MMTNKFKKTEKARLVTLALLVVFATVFPCDARAEETATFGESEASFYSEFFDRNLYDEGVNQMDLGRWGRKIFRKELPAKNINVFDEVPDSGFFTNRHGRKKLSAAELETGYQENAGPDLREPLKVVAAEQRGIYPRLWVKDARGEEYLLEFDPPGNFELVTGAEVVASRVYHALGYFVPQFTILLVKPDQFRAAPDATTWEDTGFKKSLSQERLEEYLMVLPQSGEGLYRAAACKVLKGSYHGSFSFQSRRKDDPEDLVNHRDRREIRALGIFASWLNHFDLRESDTLDMVMGSTNGHRTLTHYIADMNGALGAMREGAKAPMLGYEHAVDYGETAKTILGVGFREKPWQKKWRLSGEKVPGSQAVGYFSNERFDPARYKTQFPYEAFRSITRADGFWAANILAGFSDEDIRAMVKAGQYTDPADADAIVKTLIERRDIIVRYWFSRANTLSGFAYSNDTLSFEDLAASRGGTVYRVEVFSGDMKQRTAALEVSAPVLHVDPAWFQDAGLAKLVIRAVRPGAQRPGPAVTILLSASVIQGIRRED